MTGLKSSPSFWRIWRTRKRKKNVKKKARRFKPRPSKYIVLTFKTFVSLFIFILLIASVIFFLTSDYFKITDISCEKEELPCSEKERSFFLDLIGENIFLLDTRKIIKSIKSSYPKIENIVIEKELPNKALIKIMECQDFASLTLDEKNWFIIDQHGFILQKTDKKPKSLPEIFLRKNNLKLKLGQELDQEEVVSSLLVLKLMKENFVLLEKLVVDSEEKITLFLAENVVVSLSAGKEIARQVDSLQFILR